MADNNNNAIASPYIDPNDPATFEKLLGIPSAAPPPVRAPAFLGASPSVPQGPGAGIATVPPSMDTGAGEIAARHESDAARAAGKLAHPWGSPGNHDTTGGKIGHGLALVGNYLGNMLTPHLMADIPGTKTNLDQRVAKGEGSGLAAEKQASEEDLQKAQANKAETPPEKFAFHYAGKDEKGNDVTYGVRPDGTTEILPGGTQKPAMKIQTFTTKGPNGEPENQIVVVDESKLQGLRPADSSAGFTLPELRAAGAVSPINTGEAVAKPAAAKPLLKMVPVGEDTEQLMSLDPTNPEDMSKAKKIGAVSKKGSIQFLVDPNDPSKVKAVDSKTGKEVATDVNKGGETFVPPAAARVEQQKIQQFNTQYEIPFQQVQRGYDLYKEAQAAYNRGDLRTGAATMLMLSQHLGTTFGQIKGSRMNEALIEEHKNAIGMQDRMERFAANLERGDQLSASQVKEFGDLITNMRDLTADMTLREALRSKQPVDFLPPGAYRTGTNKSGKKVWQRSDDPQAPVISEP